LPQIARAADLIAERFFLGGAMRYFGAGTSGRLAAVDASELPPTFGVSYDLVKTSMAGGPRAFSESVEGAEDDEEAGADEVNKFMMDWDTLVGVAASGGTPYVMGAVKAAKARGIPTIGVFCREGSVLAGLVDIAIVAHVAEEDEAIFGSTRLLSGDITKRILNMISTTVMVRLGRTYGPYMVYMPPSNKKLGKRAIGMVRKIAKVSEAEAVRLLEACGKVVRVACVMGRRGIGADEARELLVEPYRVFRKALGK
jgi:N-acetylmuramic acid 6-phosphate etherase